MRKVILPIAALIIPMVVSAAGYVVSGTVVDSQSAEYIPGVRIHLYSPTDSIATSRITTTDTDGNFSIDSDTSGDFLLSLKFPGMREEKRNITFSEPTGIQLGAIPLYPDTETLQEVVVTAQRPIIQADGEKVTYNVDEDPASGNKTVIEMLRKVPLVTVDGQDNIRVNGQSDFKIYINGREDPMLSGNASTILKAMPAASIKKIEVIMEPGAKYDAEGTGGILNIVTEGKSAVEGYLATINAGVQKNSANAGVYAISKIGKVTASVNVNYYNSRFNPDDATGYMYRRNYNSDDAASVRQDISATSKNEFVNGSANLSWEPNTKNLFTASASIMRGFGDSDMNSDTGIFSRNEVLASSYNQHLKNKWDWGSFNAVGSYQHTIADGHNIVLSYQYSHGTNADKTYQFTTDCLNYSTPFPVLYNESQNPSNEHTVQADYTFPFAGHYTLESGAKGIFRRNSGDGFYLGGVSVDELVPVSDGTYSIVNLKQHQDVGAVYASLSGKWNSITAKAGLRYEHTRTALRYRTPGYEDFTSHLNDVVPNAAIAYNFAPVHSLRLSYQMRIRRPSINELNPFRTYVFSDMVQMGNPGLNSEKSHNVSLTYSNFIGFVSLNLTASYRFSDNMISPYTYLDDNIYYTTYANSGKFNEGALSAYIGFRFSPKVNLNINGTARYKDFNFAVANISNHGWEGSFGGDFNWMMPWDMTFNAYGGMMTKSITLQGSNTGWHYYGLAISKALLKENRLKLSLSANNFIVPNTSFNNTTSSYNYYSKTHFSVPAWNVGLSVSYTFGGLQSGVKKTASSIVNDDVEMKQQSGSSFGK